MRHIDRRTVLKGITAAGIATWGTQTATAAHTDGFDDEDEQTVQSQDEDEWNSFTEGHLTFRYHDGYEGDAEQVKEWYTDAEKHAVEEFPDDITIDIETIVHTYSGDKWGHHDYMLYWRNRDPAEVHLQAPSDSPNDERWHRTGLGHEEYNIVLWNHYVEAEASYGYWSRNPSWFAEGLSEYVTNRQPETIGGHPDEAIQRKKDQIEMGNGYFSLMADDEYHGGHLLCQFLLEEYDYQACFDTIANDAETWSRAFEEEFEMSQFELSLSWLDWAENNVGGNYLEGLIGASNALRTGDVDTNLLRDIINSWQSGEPVE